MTREMFRTLHPAVMYGAHQWLWGAAPAHALQQTAAFGYYMGQGQPAHQAMRMVEQMEPMMPTMWTRRAMTPAERMDMMRMTGWSMMNGDPTGQ